MPFRKKRGILFSGSFDPIHFGHMQIIYFLSKRYPKYTIYVMPQLYENKGKPLLSLKTRADAIRVSVQELKNVEVLDLAHWWKGEGQSLYKMAEILKESHKLDTLELAVGMDTFMRIKDFEYPVNLIKDYKFIVLERKGADLDVSDYFTYMAKRVYYSSSDMCYLLKKEGYITHSTNYEQVSSSEIKKNLGANQYWIPEPARLLIIEKLKKGEEL